MERALILVDIQNDFVPGGALPVPDGDRVVPVANRLMPHFDLVVATQDWHPPDHVSFAENHPGRNVGDVIRVDDTEQVLWPVHCVQETKGAELVAELDTARIERTFHKGTNPRVDSYSGFYDNNRVRSTGLAKFLKDAGVSDVYVLGLATDVCVKLTALDARRLGFKTCVVADGCRGIDLQPGDIDRAVEEMRQAGATIVQSDDLLP